MATILSRPQCVNLQLKHQSISIHSVEEIFILLDQFHTELLQVYEMLLENRIAFWKTNPVFKRLI